ncbi:hypothetical protein AAG570_004125 [Ranatra chinensis]|uniref:Uncharacterized protein n=1 Tax=Ranatra chinensis TaxID=642074 RepID=A0ABD0Y467_9HEMI
MFHKNKTQETTENAETFWGSTNLEQETMCFGNYKRNAVRKGVMPVFLHYDVVVLLIVVSTPVLFMAITRNLFGSKSLQHETDEPWQNLKLPISWFRIAAIVGCGVEARQLCEQPDPIRRR